MKTYKEIYIVDDSKIIAKIVKQTIISMEGYQAHYFLNASEMLEAIERNKPSLILMDYYLDTLDKQNMNGEEALHLVKKKYPDLPVVFLTGTSNQEVLTKIRSLPIADLIHKDHDDVLEKIASAILKNSL